MTIAVVGAACFGVALGIVCVGLVALHRRHAMRRRIDELTRYLEQAALGTAPALLPTGEDDLSRLQDELGKTVMALQRTRTDAVQVKDGFARNLAYIAHQTKTPLAALSLAADRLDPHDPIALADATRTIREQADRLKVLYDDLLVMARLDAGALNLVRTPQDVFTLVSIAVDTVEELADAACVSFEIVESGPCEVLADAHWTCEALANILKNCIEHAPAGSAVRVEYTSGPLFVEIRIIDEGPGFGMHETERVFDRFYTGARATASATGLGLAFAREIVELQQGSVRASSCSGGGACFDIRLYRH